MTPEPVSQHPYATPSPSALGVKPDARLQAAFLTQAFVWMFAGLAGLRRRGVGRRSRATSDCLDSPPATSSS